MADPEAERLVGENRCWACTVSNAIVAALVAGIPLLGGVVHGDPALLVATLLWAVAVVGYSLYRLVARGYLPGSETVAKRTGLHERIGPDAGDGKPGARSDREARTGRDDHPE